MFYDELLRMLQMAAVTEITTASNDRMHQDWAQWLFSNVIWQFDILRTVMSSERRNEKKEELTMVLERYGELV
jgi:ubiquinone/menaquinone biosynthesis C-methylase UbiE